MTGRVARAVALAGVLAVWPVGTYPLGGDPAHASHQATQCKAGRGGRQDATADINFLATLTKDAREDRGPRFELDKVQDLAIEVRWQKLRVPSRQRLELYAPSGHLYQMFTKELPAYPAPVTVSVPVRGSWIDSNSLAGTWCVKVFLDNELEPADAEKFELTQPGRR